MSTDLSRRQLLGGAAMTLAASTAEGAGGEPAREPFIFCLNTSTIRGQNLSIVDEVAIAARAGYQAIEPWINELDVYVRGGGSLRDLGRRIADAGLRVESAIGFAEFLVDDDDRRRRGLDEARRVMDMVLQLGGRRIAAPPAGMQQAELPLARAAERYRALLEVGAQLGVAPMLEVWGFSRCLNTLSDVAHIALAADHPQACILADVYHLHKGGSGFQGVRLLSAGALQVFHMNDYPAQPPRATITDADRVYPGDGVAPLREVLRELRRLGGRTVLSLELFNREYWRQDALTVARTGLEKLRAVSQ